MIIFLIYCSVADPITNPCRPSPCGPYSQCREINNHAVCSCQKDYTGTPPACRPECISSSECPQNLACVNLKCVDPCPNTCGINARCNVINHNPICSCTGGYTGDPFVRCVLEESKSFHFQRINIQTNIFNRLEKEIVLDVQGNPCVPSPCGPNSQCRVIGSTAACSCLPNFVGRSPNCRPECTINSECPGNLACIRERCVDPCPGSCGYNAYCNVIKHSAVCTCNIGYTGDPFSGCNIQPSKPKFLCGLFTLF
jgi:hypothetical protein